MSNTPKPGLRVTLDAMLGGSPGMMGADLPVLLVSVVQIAARLVTVRGNQNRRAIGIELVEALEVIAAKYDTTK